MVSQLNERRVDRVYQEAEGSGETNGVLYARKNGNIEKNIVFFSFCFEIIFSLPALGVRGKFSLTWINSSLSDKRAPEALFSDNIKTTFHLSHPFDVYITYFKNEA